MTVSKHHTLSDADSMLLCAAYTHYKKTDPSDIHINFLSFNNHLPSKPPVPSTCPVRWLVSRSIGRHSIHSREGRLSTRIFLRGPKVVVGSRRHRPEVRTSRRRNWRTIAAVISNGNAIELLWRSRSHGRLVKGLGAGVRVGLGVSWLGWLALEEEERVTSVQRRQIVQVAAHFLCEVVSNILHIRDYGDDLPISFLRFR